MNLSFARTFQLPLNKPYKPFCIQKRCFSEPYNFHNPYNICFSDLWNIKLASQLFRDLFYFWESHSRTNIVKALPEK